MFCFDVFFLPILTWCLLGILCIVISFDIFKTFLDLQLTVKGTF